MKFSPKAFLIYLLIICSCVMFGMGKDNTGSMYVALAVLATILLD